MQAVRDGSVLLHELAELRAMMMSRRLSNTLPVSIMAFVAQLAEKRRCQNQRSVDVCPLLLALLFCFGGGPRGFSNDSSS
jgi:hypothetical protein